MAPLKQSVTLIDTVPFDRSDDQPSPIEDRKELAEHFRQFLCDATHQRPLEINMEMYSKFVEYRKSELAQNKKA